MPGDSSDPVAAARRLADEVLFPAALDTDRSPLVPTHLLDRLARAGLFGLMAPAAAGGLEADEPTRMAVTEALAGGCLTTAFVWAQHHSAVRATAVASTLPDAPEEGRRRWRAVLGELASGHRRTGVAFAGLRRPGPPLLTARPDGDRWLLRGRAPWVTGWGLVDDLLVAARGPAGEVVWFLIEARLAPTIELTPLRLAAVAASSTVALQFSDHPVEGDHLVLSEPFEDWAERDRMSQRPNGALAVGVAERCTRLLGPGPFDRRLAATRDRLLRSGPGEVPAARAEATRLAAEAAMAVVVSGGGSSVLMDHHAQRLAREAMFLQVFGQTSAIRGAQLRSLGV